MRRLKICISSSQTPRVPHSPQRARRYTVNKHGFWEAQTYKTPASKTVRVKTGMKGKRAWQRVRPPSSLTLQGQNSSSQSDIPKQEIERPFSGKIKPSSEKRSTDTTITICIENADRLPSHPTENSGGKQAYRYIEAQTLLLISFLVPHLLNKQKTRIIRHLKKVCHTGERRVN